MKALSLILTAAAVAVTLLLTALAPALSLAQSARNIKFTGNIEYGTGGRQKLLLDIYRPRAALPAGKLRAAVLLVHGGAWEEGNKEEFRDIALYLAGNGYVAVSINYRLMSPDEGQRARDTSNAWPAQIDDVQLAVRWMRENAATYGFDPQKIVAMGGSAGGHLVTLLGTCDTLHPQGAALTQHSSRVAAVVNLAGPTDLTVNFAVGIWTPMATSLQRRLFQDKLEGTGPREASPLYHIDAKTVPMLLLHGKDDMIVSVKQSETFAAAMTKAGRDAKLVVFEGEGHGFAKEENNEKMLEDTLEFLKKQVGE
ncbi:MAG: alpha/beta fold hydrolase [Candidatus Methylacidiphilales bacterium]